MATDWVSLYTALLNAENEAGKDDPWYALAQTAAQTPITWGEDGPSSRSEYLTGTLGKGLMNALLANWHKTDVIDEMRPTYLKLAENIGAPTELQNQISSTDFDPQQVKPLLAQALMEQQRTADMQDYFGQLMQKGNVGLLFAEDMAKAKQTAKGGKSIAELMGVAERSQIGGAKNIVATGQELADQMDQLGSDIGSGWARWQAAKVLRQGDIATQYSTVRAWIQQFAKNIERNRISDQDRKVYEDINMGNFSSRPEDVGAMIRAVTSQLAKQTAGSIDTYDKMRSDEGIKSTKDELLQMADPVGVVAAPVAAPALVVPANTMSKEAARAKLRAMGVPGY